MPIEIVCDASPYGYGAYIVVGGSIVSYFAAPVTNNDCDTLGINQNSDGQQAFECMCVLIALRLWTKIWACERFSLAIKGDNITALAMVTKMKAQGPALRKIAREMALDLAETTYEPDLAVHTPGVQNDVADWLSRVFEPGADKPMPVVLNNALRQYPPRRDQAWWRVTHNPPSQPAAPDGE